MHDEDSFPSASTRDPELFANEAPTVPSRLLLPGPLPAHLINASEALDVAPLPHQSSHGGRSAPPVVAVSISLGSSTRNSRAETTLLGQAVIVSRVGVDGDRTRARALYEELDGRVDAFGFGGGDFAVTVDRRSYAFSSLESLTAGLKTPVVDGAALRSVIERRLVQRLPDSLTSLKPRRVLITTAVDRYDLLCSFDDADFELLCGDLGFVFGIPIALRSVRSLHRMARTLLPLVRRLPFEMLYPTGSKQESIHTRFQRWFDWATFIGGDFLFLRTHLPARLDGKVIVTNTTTAEDVELLRDRGALALVTSTPRIDGRSFGTNAIEAALTAIAGKGRPLTQAELADMIGDGLQPTVTFLNEPS